MTFLPLLLVKVGPELHVAWLLAGILALAAASVILAFRRHGSALWIAVGVFVLMSFALLKLGTLANPTSGAMFYIALVTPLGAFFGAVSSWLAHDNEFAVE